jgi:uncharacterized membrane protein YdjX (TVP38/TMEM64 family)
VRRAPTPATQSGSLGHVLRVLFLSALVPLVPFAIIGELPGERYLQASGQSALAFGLAGAGLLACDVLLPIPSSLLGALLGARLGFVPGTAWAFVGLAIGHAIGYAIGRLVPSRKGAALDHAPTFALVLLTRPVPVLAEAVAITAGALRVPFVRYAPPMLLGNLLYAAAMAGNGAALLPSGLAGPGLVLPLAVPVLGWLGFVAYQKRSAR